MATKKTETDTAGFSTMNIWKKLLEARAEFYAEGAQKTGRNLHAEFMYFELSDIVPIAEPIFRKYGLLMKTVFTDYHAVAEIVNVDNPEQTITFTIPLRFIAEPAKFRMNEVQGVGAVVTYYRRYLYMTVLDLVEAEELDAKKPAAESEKITPISKTKKPVSAAERQTIKEELTNADGPAEQLQIDGLRAALKTLMERDPEQEDFVQQIAVKTNAFTEITKAQCEELIKGVREMIAAYPDGGES